jgi:hypothetical protein
MDWRRRVALCAVLVVLPSTAAAQGGLTGRVRYLGGYTHETPETFGSSHDVWSAVVPEVSYLFVEPRWQLRTTYAFTAAVHTRNPTEIANRLSVVSSYELSRRTTLLLSADANQTSLSNYLITRPLVDTTTVLVPSSNSRLLTATASEGLVWEASPSVLLGQGLAATYVTSLDPEVQIDNAFASAFLSLERTWKRDALGGEVRAAYTSVDSPPTASGKFVTFTAAPRWRHDLGPSLSSTLAAGASIVVSPDPETEPLVTPSVRGALLYTVETSSLELSYAAGAAPNVLTGQMLRSHLVTLRGGVPLSERHRLFANGSIGYLNGTLINLRRDPALGATPEVNALLSDVEVTWLATDWMQLFVRGLFLAQDNGSDAPAFVREAGIVGVQFSSRSPDGVAIPVRFPQRVDRSDGASSR